MSGLTSFKQEARSPLKGENPQLPEGIATGSVRYVRVLYALAGTDSVGLKEAR